MQRSQFVHPTLELVQWQMRPRPCLWLPSAPSTGSGLPPASSLLGFPEMVPTPHPPAGGNLQVGFPRSMGEFSGTFCQRVDDPFVSISPVPCKQWLLFPKTISQLGGHPGCRSVSPHILPTSSGSQTPLTVNLQRPPRSSLLSKQVGSRPSSRQHLMEARPPTPAPTIATVLAIITCVWESEMSL